MEKDVLWATVTKVALKRSVLQEARGTMTAVESSCDEEPMGSISNRFARCGALIVSP